MTVWNRSLMTISGTFRVQPDLFLLDLMLCRWDDGTDNKSNIFCSAVVTSVQSLQKTKLYYFTSHHFPGKCGFTSTETRYHCNTILEFEV